MQNANSVKRPVLLLFVLLHSTSHGQELSRDSLVRKYFTVPEVVQLDQLIASFESQIDRITSKTGEESYRSYLKMDSLYVADEIDYTSYCIPADSVKEILYAVNSSLFNQIFYYSYGLDLDAREPTSRFVSPKYDGPYVQLGKRVGETNQLWNYYFNAIMGAGDISPAATATLPYLAGQHANLNRFSDRLFIALHYLLTMAPKEKVDSSEVNIPWLNDAERKKMKHLDKLPKKLLTIINHRSDTVVAELWIYPAEGYPKNKAGAFEEIIAPNDSMLLVYNGTSIYEGNVKISSAYKMNEQEGYEILVYRNMADELVIFGDTKKDTVYFQKHPIDSFSIINPLSIEIE